MTTRKYLGSVLLEWYSSLGLLNKIVYPLLALGIYLLSVLFVVGLYWLKTDLGYNLLSKGGWHSFAHCLVREAKLTQQ